LPEGYIHTYTYNLQNNGESAFAAIRKKDNAIKTPGHKILTFSH